MNYSFQGTNGISGVTGILKNNTGAVTLATPNSYSGGTTVNAGTLNIDNNAALGTGSFTINGGVIDNTSLTPVTLAATNAQNWNADIVFTGTSALNLGTGAVALSASRIVTTNGTEPLTVVGVMSGDTFSLTKNGGGSLILGGVDTYNAGTTLNAGTLQLNQTTGAANIGIINVAGGNLVFNPPANNFGYAATINLSAEGTISKIGNFQINYTGTLNGNGNALNVSTSAGRLYINGNTTNGVSQFNVTGGAMGFDLSTNNNQGGGAPVFVSNGAPLWFANGVVPMANNVTLYGGTGQGGTGALFQEGAGTPTLSGMIPLDSDVSSIGGNNATGVVNVTGKVTGAGGLAKIGDNRFTLSGPNDYTGSTAVNAGTLAAGSTTAFGVNSAVSLANLAGANLDITGFNVQIGSLTGGGAAGGNVILGAATLTTGGDGTSPAAYAGVISGTGSLAKTGLGSQILSGASSFTGNIVVSGGSLIAARNNNSPNPVTSALGNPQASRSLIVDPGGTLNFADGDSLGGATSDVVSTLVINAGGTDYKVQISSTLTGWTDVEPGDPNLSDGSPLVYNLPVGEELIFVRLLVNPN